VSSSRLVIASSLLLLATACGSSSSSPQTPTAPAPNGPAVSIPKGAEVLGNQAFAPDSLDVTAGSTVTWTNTDSVTHTSTSDNGAWNSGNIGSGKQFSVSFPTAGTFSYHCTIHPGMVGTVVVH
jgi:plastocyanin